MAIAYSGRSASANIRGTTVTSNSMVVHTGDFLILVGAGGQGTNTFTPSTTGIGGTWNAVTTAVTNSTNCGLQIFWNNTFTAADGSSQTFSVTTNTGRDSEIVVAAFTGVKTTTPVDASTSTSSTTSSTSITTLTANDLIISAVSANNSTAWSAGTIGGTAATLIANTGADQGALAVEFLIVTTATAYSTSFTGGGGTFCSQSAAFIDASAGGGGGSSTISLLASLGVG